MTVLLRRQAPVITLLVVAFIATLFIQHNFVYLDASATMATNALLALSVGLIWGQGGILSIAQASLAAIGAYTVAIATMHYGWSPYATLPLALLLPAVVAFLLARVVTRLVPLALSIATFAFGEILYIVLRSGGTFTGGYAGIGGIPPIVLADSPLTIHITSWIGVALAVIVYTNVKDSPFGRSLRTIRHDRVRAAADGVNVSGTLSLVFALSGAFAGLAGWLYALRMTYVASESFTSLLSIQVVLMAVIGGAGVALGPVLGAVLLSGADLFLPGAEQRGLLYGAVLIVMLVVAPRGLLGSTWVTRLTKKRDRSWKRDRT